jgi:hypothetical protein
MPDDGSVSIRVPDSMTYEEAQKVLALVEQMQATLRRLAQAEQDKVRLSALQADLLNTITEGSS